MLVSRSSLRAVVVAALLGTPVVAQQQPAAPGPAPTFARQVEIRRDAYGVPHIKAENLGAAFYALAWLQLEDYGPNIALGIFRARGEAAAFFGREALESDFLARPQYEQAVQSYQLLDQDTRETYEGFAAGLDRYVELHPEEFPPGFAPHFTAYDVLARDVGGASLAQAQRFLAKMDPTLARRPGRPQAGVGPGSEGADPIEEGSNAWAFAPSRTKSGRAILLRNPHLSWTSGYYEAQMTVPGKFDFYGDFRIGGPYAVVGGFNQYLGWSTTNNDPDLEEIYALDVDPARPDHFLFDGTSVPVERVLLTARFRNGPGLSSETRETWRTPIGPVIYRGGGKVYVLKAAGQGDYRGGEQFLRMMKAHSLAEWKDAMRIRARVTSNFTYADRAGNIFEVWNASIPSLPHPPGDDTTAVPAHGTSEVWTRYVSFDSLPQFLNPKGGYVHNENDPPHFGNLRQPLDPKNYPANFPAPRLGLRSQMALTLIDQTKPKLTLEDVIALKHSYRMLLADRVKPDLLAAVRAGGPSPEVARAIDMIAAWDNTVAPTSRGGILFELWWRKYTEGQVADSMYAQPWSASAPMATPRGLKDPARAATAFAWAVAETARRYGAADVAWGDVHRVRIDSVDVPVGGCSGALGCFRVLNYRDDPDGKREAIGGDGWVLAVEFTDIPKAYSILAYGESTRPGSPLHSNQAAMFARGQMKKVLYTDADVEAGTVRRYHPGEIR